MASKTDSGSSYQLFKETFWLLGSLIGPNTRGLDAAYEALHDKIAEELSDEIREETAQLKADGVLEPDKFRPCRDVADQIDPRVQLRVAQEQNSVV